MGTSSRSTQTDEIKIVNAETSRKTNEKLSRRLSLAIIPFHPVAEPELSDHIVNKTMADKASPTSEIAPVIARCFGKNES